MHFQKDCEFVKTKIEIFLFLLFSFGRYLLTHIQIPQVSESSIDSRKNVECTTEDEVSITHIICNATVSIGERIYWVAKQFSLCFAYFLEEKKKTTLGKAICFDSRTLTHKEMLLQLVRVQVIVTQTIFKKKIKNPLELKCYSSS